MRVTVKIARSLLAGWLLLAACAPLPMTAPPPPPSIVGRWEVQGTPGVHIPHSFFWFTMDYLEFRADGTVLALMRWPPDGGEEIRLNKTTQYTLRGDNQIQFEGSCRHEDPCTGVYTVTRTADTLRIFDDSGALNLQWVAPPAEIPPPAVEGPAPSPTP